MHVEIDLSAVGEWWESVPTWAAVTAVVLAYYFLAGLLIRWLNGGVGPRSDAGALFGFWVFSPVFFTILLVTIALWALSAGIVIPPWRWDQDTKS